MAQVCILTDSAIQFPAGAFPGREHVYVLPYHLHLSEQVYIDGPDLKASDLPPLALNGCGVELHAPSPETIQRILLRLQPQYQEAVVLMTSSLLSPAMEQAQRALAGWGCGLRVHLIDSQNLGAGLGWLVQAAAQASREGASGVEIERLVNRLIPHIYTLVCTRSLTYLARSGQIEPAQALVGEMLGLAPFWVLENGRLVSPQKAYRPHQTVEVFFEFMVEFAKLKNIALLKCSSTFSQEARLLRDRLHNTFPQTPLNEYGMSASLAAILGPSSLGLFTFEDGYRRLAA